MNVFVTVYIQYVHLDLHEKLKSRILCEVHGPGFTSVFLLIWMKCSFYLTRLEICIFFLSRSLQRKLTDVSAEEWAALPDVGDVRNKKMRNPRPERYGMFCRCTNIINLHVLLYWGFYVISTDF